MSETLDLLLVTPPSRLEVYQELSKEFAAVEPPVWSGLIAEFARNKGYDVVILDAEADGLTHEQTAQAIIDASPVLTVFVIYGQQPSASTQCMPGARKVVCLVNEKTDLPTMVMGTHASALPLRTLIEEPYTYVCQGEGPYTVVSLIEALKAKCEFSHVPGLWYYEDTEVKHNEMAPNIHSLDKELPKQAWDMLDMHKYKAHNWHCFHDLNSRGSYASLQTSLGCPYRCSFCCINAPFGKHGIRYWSPENIIQQIDVLVNDYQVKNIKIPDEMFVLNKHHVLGICDLVIERGYDLNFWAYSRIDTVQDYFLEKLKKAGFNWLGLGIESGSKHVRDGVEKGKFGQEEIVATVKKIQNHGIYVGANYIFGLPDDTHETMQETLDLALFINAEWANFYCAMAYPGSELYPLAKKNNWQLPDDPGGSGWIGYSQHSYDCMPLPTESLSSTEVLDFRDGAFHKYFENQSYLGMMKRKFGPHVVNHIKEMTSYSLQRCHRE